MAQDSSLRFDLTEWARNPRPALVGQRSLIDYGGGSPQLYYHDCSGRIPGHTTRALPVGFELETNRFQFDAIANLDKTSLNLTTSQISIFGFSVLHRMFEVLHIDWQVRTPLPRKLILQFLAFNLLPPEFNLLLSSSFLVKRFHLKKNTKSFHPRVQISMLIWF